MGERDEHLQYWQERCRKAEEECDRLELCVTKRVINKMEDLVSSARDILAQVGNLSPSQIRERAKAANLLEDSDGK